MFFFSVRRTRPGAGSGESGGVIATYCFSTSAMSREYDGLRTISLTVVTKLGSDTDVRRTATDRSSNSRERAEETAEGCETIKIIRIESFIKSVFM